MEKALKKQDIAPLLSLCGITDFGIIDFKLVAPWLIDCRTKARIPESPQSVIITIFPYLVEDTESNISRYARVPDYHTVILPCLTRAAEALQSRYGCSCACFADNSPIPEVFAAASAGLGVTGNNHLLITPEYGSYVFIGEIITSLLFEKPEKKQPAACSHCNRCAQYCRAGILPQGNMKNCLSGITQKKGPLDHREIRLIWQNKYVWGCDACQTVCPLNQRAKRTPIPAFIKGYRSNYRPGEDAQDRAYAWRPRSVIDRNYMITQQGE